MKNNINITINKSITDMFKITNRKLRNNILIYIYIYMFHYIYIHIYEKKTKLYIC